jgi:hypothetical protein
MKLSVSKLGHSPRPYRQGLSALMAMDLKGAIAGVALEVKITQPGANRFNFQARGRGADLTGTAIPVSVGISIGDDNGNVTLKSALLIAGSHPVRLDTSE